MDSNMELSSPSSQLEVSTHSEQSEQHAKSESARVGPMYQCSQLPEFRSLLSAAGALEGASSPSSVLTSRLDDHPVDCEQKDTPRVLSEEEHREFLAALEYEGKDFRAVAKAMGGGISSHAIVLHYYCTFKHSPEYRAWRARVEERADTVSADGKPCMYLRSRVRSEHPADPMGIVRRRIRYKFTENGKSTTKFGVVCARTPTSQGFYRVRFSDNEVELVKITQRNRGSVWDLADDQGPDIPEVTSADRRPRSTMSRKSSYASFVNENWSDSDSLSKEPTSRGRKGKGGSGGGAVCSVLRQNSTSGPAGGKGRKTMSKNAVHKAATSAGTPTKSASGGGKGKGEGKRGKAEKREREKGDDNGCRWSAKRVDLATSVIVEVLESDPRGKVPRHELREAARTRIGDTGLLDWVLKQLGGRVVHDWVVCRELNTANRMLEFRLEKADTAAATAAREERLRVLGAEAAAKAAARGEAREMKEAARAMVEGVSILRQRSSKDLTKLAAFAPPTPSGVAGVAASPHDSERSDRTGFKEKDDPSVQPARSGGSGSVGAAGAIGAATEGSPASAPPLARPPNALAQAAAAQAAAHSAAAVAALASSGEAAEIAAAMVGLSGLADRLAANPTASRVSSRVRQPARKVLEAVDALAGYRGKRKLPEAGEEMLSSHGLTGAFTAVGAGGLGGGIGAGTIGAAVAAGAAVVAAAAEEGAKAARAAGVVGGPRSHHESAMRVVCNVLQG